MGQDPWAVALIWQITPEVFATWGRLSWAGFGADTPSGAQSAVCLDRLSEQYVQANFRHKKARSDLKWQF